MSPLPKKQRKKKNNERMKNEEKGIKPSPADATIQTHSMYGWSEGVGMTELRMVGMRDVMRDGVNEMMFT